MMNLSDDLIVMGVDDQEEQEAENGEVIGDIAEDADDLGEPDNPKIDIDEVDPDDGFDKKIADDDEVVN